MPELMKSVKAARTDMRDVTIDAQIQGNVHAEQTYVADGDGFDTSQSSGSILDEGLPDKPGILV